MALFDIFKRNKPDFRNLLRAFNEYVVSTGTAQPIPDNPEDYINEVYAGNGDVYSLINKIISMSRQGEIKLRKKTNDGYEDIEGHELNTFLGMVNRNMTFEQFWAAHFIYKLAVGNSYWYKPLLESGLNKGKTISLHIMPAQFTEVIAGDWINPVQGYQLNFNPTVEFSDEEVFHSKFFDPRFDESHFLYGISPLKAAAQIVAKLNEAEKSEQRQFENQSPPYILYKKDPTGSANITTQQKKDLQKELRDLAADKKRGRPMFLKFEPGIEKLGISPVDLNILQSSQEGMRRLCNIYQFPSVLMNDTANSTYNNIETARKSAWTDCIIPHNKTFAKELTLFLISPIAQYEGYEYYFDYSKVQELQTTNKDKVEYLIKAKATPNEIREAINYPPIDNPLMDEPFFPQNEIPLSEILFDDSDEKKDYIDYLGQNDKDKPSK